MVKQPVKNTKHKLPYYLGGLLLLFALTTPSFCQFYFGRNKIQYEQFEWQVLSTDHFNIYYYKEEHDLVQLAAYYAEEAFDELEQKFNHTIITPIPLIIYSNHIHFQQTNVLPIWIPEGVGGFFEFLKRRVVIPYSGKLDEFRHVIRHELVHVFMHHKIISVASDIGLWDAPHFPLWFIEGLAEYWSEGWDSDAELIIRDAVLHDYLFPLDSYKLMQAGYLLYKEGQSFLQFYENTYGADRIRALMEQCWRYESFEDAMTAISGKKYSQVTDEWKLELKQKFAHNLAKESVLKPNEFQMTEHGSNISPDYYIGKDGKRKLIYLSNRYGYTDIYSQTDKKKKANPLIKGERNAGYESLHFLQTGFNINSQGQLVLVTKSGSQDVLRVINIENRHEVTSMQQSDLVTIRSPKWSPDNTKILFSAQNEAGYMDIYLWEINKEQVIRLTNDLYTDRSPCFDPTCKWIVFESDRTTDANPKGSNLFLMDSDTKEIIQITDNDAINSKPVWSNQDQDLIYFLSDITGTMNVWTASVNLSDFPSINHTIQLKQITNYHTGVYDVLPVNSDTLLSTVFLKYNFQIHQLPVQPDTSFISIQTRAAKTDYSGIDLPSISGISRKESRPYRMKYSLDFAQTAVAYDPIFGFLGGAQLSISDIFGNRYYHFLLANTAETSSEIMDRFNIAVTFVDLAHRSNRAIGIFHFANDYFDPYQGFYFERAIGLRGAINYPIDVFHRLEFSTSLWSSIKDDYFSKLETAYLVSNYFSFIHDNSLWTYTGPIDGWRFRFTFGPTFDFFKSHIHNYTALFDFRYYWRFHRKVTFAQRSIFWLNEGTDIRRFYIGGSWGIRGYRIMEVYGSKYVLFNNEFRFPFAESVMIKFKKMGIGLAPVRSALFFDIGNAWDDGYPGMLGSFGFGLRGNLLGGLVLRLDMGKTTDFRKLDKGLFFQFFFGWDY